MSVIKLEPKALKGNIEVPSSKSYGHRALICAALSNKPCSIININFSEDIKATLSCLKALGYRFKVHTDSVESCGFKASSMDSMYCKESGSTLRFIIPIAALSEKPWSISGEPSLMSRPLQVYEEIFHKQGLEFSLNNIQSNLHIKGPIKADDFKVRGDISSQFISGLLFALPLLEGNSSIEVITPLESKKYIDITLDIIRKFGVNIAKERSKYIIRGNQSYNHYDYKVEGDYSQAAFWMVGAALSGEIVLNNLNIESLQPDKDIIKILTSMGVKIESMSHGVKVYKSDTVGIDIDASQIPDIVPIIAVLASLSKGTTNIYNAGRLRIKESDRLKAITEGLNRLGAKVREQGDSLIIEGVKELKGGCVKGYNDHRIVMSLAIASTVCREGVYIEDAEAVNKSYPDFFKDFHGLSFR